ncbi:primosomal protein N' [Chitinibacteraceae bacterium HSL-7]
MSDKNPNSSAVYLVSVALDVPIDQLFDYEMPADKVVSVGERVVVPFGRRMLSGIVLKVHQDRPEGRALKSVALVPGDMPALPDALLRLCRFTADYYQMALGCVLSIALPQAFRQTEPWLDRRRDPYWQARDVEALLGRIASRAHKQRELAEHLREPIRQSVARRLAGDAARWLTTWADEGLVHEVTPPAQHWQPVKGKQLNAEQAQAVSTLAGQQGYAAFLLYGITGSGKTEVYLQTIADYRQRGRQVLVLVPEINLTPQLETRFRERFPQEHIVSLHSGMADGERTRGWMAAATGEAGIVLGTRLSVFTPMPDLGLIVVDEEHDGSYRQNEGVRYSARDLAIVRARQADVPVVLGSATPSIESWHNVQEGRYRLLTLTQRAVHGARLPELSLLPMIGSVMQEGLTPQAIAAVRKTTAAGGQVLVFVNRRGYAPVLNCTACGWMSSCPHCSARLVLHRDAGRLRCHHCGHESRVPHACPDCGNADMSAIGVGTQRVEAALTALFPQANVLRIDRDSTRRKGTLGEMLAQVHDGDADILVGTQMLAKGHDFPGVQLVLVLNADSGLFSADFRAEEKLFAQLMQVAGRAGRAGQEGRVLIQTQFPEHPFFAALIEGDYAEFAGRLLDERRALELPPFSAWALVRAEGRDGRDVQHALRDARQLLQEQGVDASTPLPALLARKAGLERMHSVVSAPSRKKLAEALYALRIHWQNAPPPRIRWLADVDPHDF